MFILLVSAVLNSLFSNKIYGMLNAVQKLKPCNCCFSSSLPTAHAYLQQLCDSVGYIKWRCWRTVWAKAEEQEHTKCKVTGINIYYINMCAVCVCMCVSPMRSWHRRLYHHTSFSIVKSFVWGVAQTALWVCTWTESGKHFVCLSLRFQRTKLC